MGTEDRNPGSKDLDCMTPREIVSLMHKEDLHAAQAVGNVLEQVAQAAELARKALMDGGRLIYVGAGTSGRLGVLDASECPPTFGVPEDTVVGVIAGGEDALCHAVEGAEDSPELGEQDLKRIGLCEKDMVIGIAASGRTPYVMGALAYAGSLGCKTAALTNHPGSELSRQATIAIEPDTGAEVLTGSTRLKAGTAQKMILNMISTATMCGLGHVYQNLMVDVQQSNEKLCRRAESIVMQATGEDAQTARQALAQAGGNAKLAIVMLLLDTDADTARIALKKGGGSIRGAMKE